MQVYEISESDGPLGCYQVQLICALQPTNFRWPTKRLCRSIRYVASYEHNRTLNGKISRVHNGRKHFNGFTVPWEPRCYIIFRLARPFLAHYGISA